MSESFLSQEEVDALLEGVTGESQKLSEELQEQGEVRAYSISSQERIVRGRMPSMEIVNERFARNLRVAVAALGDLLVSPGFFHRMGFRCPLDGNHLLPLHVTHRGNARAPGFAIDVDRAGAAQALTATEFGAGQLQLFPQHTTAACRD